MTEAASPEPAKPKIVPPPAPKPAAPTASRVSLPPPARQATLQTRHIMVGLSFIALVLLPLVVAAWYLWFKADDQFASTVGFSVRTEEMSSPLDFLGSVTGISSSSSSDTDILYDYLNSQELVTAVNDAIDLKALWSKPEDDPVFSYDPEGSIEDLMNYWSSMVFIDYDVSTRIIEIRTLAFAPEDAQLINETVFTKSSEMINALSQIAQEDAIRLARDELQIAVSQLKAARQAVTEFRNVHQMVDPVVDIQVQAGLLGTLQQQLAAALIEMDLLMETTRGNDARVAQMRRRVEVIEQRIAAERQKLGMGGAANEDTEAYASVLGEFEGLSVDREFAETTYLARLTTYNTALNEARRQSRYLAAHIVPTLAETAEYPRRFVNFGLAAVLLFLSWSILVLVGYSLRDRR